MSFAYQPLADDEIRLLTFEEPRTSPRNDDSCQITCTIEHVRLQSTTNVTFPERFKGDTYVWPELSAPHDTSTLFQNDQDPCLEEEEPQSRTQELGIERDEDLQWRYEWGDFIALSYAWRPAAPQQSIIVNGSPFEVTCNLYDALTQLIRCQRIRQGFKLWIDAICINQDDLAERGRQVGRMRDIYQSAWQVVIWTGPEEDDSSLAVTALHWLARESKRPEPLQWLYRETKMIDARPLFIRWPSYQGRLKKAVYQALFRFFARPYWQRMWIIQEVAAGTGDTPVLCGDKCISWGDLYDVAKIISSDEGRLGRDILDSSQPQLLAAWPFAFGKDRQPEKRQFASERQWGLQIAMMGIQKMQQHAVSTREWHKLAKVLAFVRDASVTEERDRVYGILGIKAVADNLVWESTPDYTLSLADLYSNFTSAFLATGNLSILRLVSRYAGPRLVGQRTFEDLPPKLRRNHTGPIALWALNTSTGPVSSPEAGTPCFHDVPSWTICWTCAAAPTAQLGGLYQADASLGYSPPVFPSMKSTLIVKGFKLDTITTLSASHPQEVDTSYPCNITSSQPSIYGDLEATRNAFWRTIVGDTTPEGGEKAPESYSWLLDRRLWQKGAAGVWTYGIGLHNFMTRNRDLRLCGYTLEELILGLNKWVSRCRLTLGENFYNPSETQREALSWAINAMAWRRIFGTKHGRIGMGTCAAEVGDSIVIVRGCNTPLVLRRSGDGWKLVGECYTHGVMYGEVAAKEGELEDILLY